MRNDDIFLSVSADRAETPCNCRAPFSFLFCRIKGRNVSEIKFSRTVLSNGLPVIIHKDDQVGSVVVNLTYNVGARDEQPDKTGFAHLFEHLMFGGSKNVPEYDSILQQAGGQNNAFTTNDVTNYYVSVPASQLEIAMWVESDRMLELDFSQKVLDVQKSVVVEEFKQRYLNKPFGDAHHILRAKHFQIHPYRWPTIGKEISHIQNATLEDVKEFFFGFYAPNNASLVIAGNVEEGYALEMAEKWFGNIPKRNLLKKALPIEPPQTEARRETVYRSVPQDAVYKMYHIPGRLDKGYVAADAIADILSHGKASVLYNRLVKEKEICSSVRAFSWSAHDPGMISIDAFLRKGKTVDEYEDALSEIFMDLPTLIKIDLPRIKNAIEASGVMSMVSLLNRAMTLGIYDILGDANLANTSILQYLDLSEDELLEVGPKVFSPQNCSTLNYLSESRGDNQ